MDSLDRVLTLAEVHRAAVNADLDNRSLIIQYNNQPINIKCYVATTDIVWKNLSIGLKSKRFIRIFSTFLLVGVFILFAVPSVRLSLIRPLFTA